MIFLYEKKEVVLIVIVAIVLIISSVIIVVVLGIMKIHVGERRVKLIVILWLVLRTLASITLGHLHHHNPQINYPMPL